MNAVQTSKHAPIAAEWANIVLGIWVAVSPFILGFQNVAARWSNLAVGVALVLVALASEWINRALESLVVPLGVWIFMSPFVLGFSREVFLANNVAMAFIVIAAGAISNGLRLPEASNRAS